MNTQLLKDLVTVTKEWIAEAFPKLRPAEDLLPQLVVLDGTQEISMLAIPGAYLESRETKINLAVLMRRFCRSTKATAAAFAFHAWIRKGEERKPDGTIEGMPGCVEKMVILEIRGGAVTCHEAAVVRHDSGPPSLGEWETSTPHNNSGIFADAILPILAENISAATN